MTIDRTIEASAGYEAPALAEVGTLHELTLGCDKAWGDSDGHTFAGVPITCASASSADRYQHALTLGRPATRGN